MTVALVWAHMQTLPRRRVSRPGALVSLLAILIVAGIAACGSAAAPPAAEAPSSPPASLAPNEGPDASVGIDLPAPSEDPALIDPLVRIVVPKPGQLDVRPVPAQTLSAVAAGRHVTLTIDYTSGVEPCNILDSIVVAVRADAKTFAITLREGHGPQDVMCIEIAESRRAIVDLVDLAPGTYAISDTTGGAAPITVTVD
jgi:ABC-type transport system substrate-binding protein